MKPVRVVLLLLLVLGLLAASLFWRATAHAPDGAAVVEPARVEGPPDAAASPDGVRGRPVPTAVPRPSGGPTPADAQPAPPAAAPVRSSWGGGPDQLGRSRPREGNPEAPMSLTVAPDGSTVVIDQVNGRLVRIKPDGTREAIPSPLQHPQDLTIAPDGTLLVLDRLADRTVALVSPDGKLIGQLPMPEARVGESGGVTGVFVDRGAAYVEREHGALVKLGDTQGKPADGDPEELPGRPSRDGACFLSAALLDGPQGRVLVEAIDRAEGIRRFGRELRLDEPVRAILLLDSDQAGNVYVGLLLAGAEASRVALIALDGRDGHPLGRRDVPGSSGPEETFREFSVRDDGTIVHLRHDDAGASIATWSVP